MGLRVDERRRALLALLDFSPEEPTVIGGNGDPYGLAGLFARLLTLPDAVVLEVVAVVMGESLAAGSVAVEAAGQALAVDMAGWWHADAVFLDQLRDRGVLLAIVADVAGDAVAAAHAKENGATLRAILRDHLDGSNGRARVDGWVPRRMRFPPAAYTARGGVGTVAGAALVAAAAEPVPGKDEEQQASGSGQPREGGEVGARKARSYSRPEVALRPQSRGAAIAA